MTQVMTPTHPFTIHLLEFLLDLLGDGEGVEGGDGDGGDGALAQVPDDVGVRIMVGDAFLFGGRHI